MSSHDALTNRIDRYLAGKELPGLDPGVREAGLQLRSRVSDYRDFRIAHDKVPQATRAVLYAPGVARIVLANLQVEPHYESEPPDELYRDLNAYLQRWMEYLRANASSCRLKARQRI